MSVYTYTFFLVRRKSHEVPPPLFIPGPPSEGGYETCDFGTHQRPSSVYRGGYRTLPKDYTPMRSDGGTTDAWERPLPPEPINHPCNVWSNFLFDCLKFKLRDILTSHHNVYQKWLMEVVVTEQHTPPPPLQYGGNIMMENMISHLVMPWNCRGAGANYYFSHEFRPHICRTYCLLCHEWQNPWMCTTITYEGTGLASIGDLLDHSWCWIYHTFHIFWF